MGVTGPSEAVRSTDGGSTFLYDVRDEDIVPGVRIRPTFASAKDVETVLSTGMVQGLIETWDRL